LNQSVGPDVELVIHPGDATLPDLVFTAAPVLPDKVSLSYPLIPPVITVRGSVVGDDGTPVPADIALESQELSVLDDAAAAKDLRYAGQISTTDDGAFERKLPPGKYSAIVTPAPSSGYAKTVVDLAVDVPANKGDVVQEGKRLALQRPVFLRGTCITTDG